MPRSTLTKMSAGIGLVCLMVAVGPIPIASVQSAEPTIAPSPMPAKAEPTKADPIAQQLLGQWKTQQPIGGETLTLIFAPAGKCYLIFNRAAEKPTAIELQYQINANPKPMHLDFVLPGQGTVQTLFELAGKELRVQLTQTSPGKPRPTAFQEPTTMQKITDATTLPPGVEVYDPKREASRPNSQSEGKTDVGTMTRTQMVYFLENNKFASTLKDLGTDIMPETENYRYQIVPQGTGKQVMMTGQAKKAGLRSYTGAVFVTQSQSGAKEETPIAVLCESTQPSMTAPAMPKLTPATPTQAVQIVCPVGSQLVWK